jgi:hypothetical protein
VPRPKHFIRSPPTRTLRTILTRSQGQHRFLLPSKSLFNSITIVRPRPWYSQQEKAAFLSTFITDRPRFCPQTMHRSSAAASILSLALVVIAVSAGTAPVLGLNATSSTCGGNCPGGCASCPCGTSPSSQSISTWCSKHGWNQANCQCIMKHESGGNAHAVNQNSGGSYDVGLWQINQQNWASCSGGGAPCDPSTNLNCAIKVGYVLPM